MLKADADSGNATLTGQGTTIWSPLWTFVCPNGTSTTSLPVVAYWWPQAPGSAPTSITAVNGTAEAVVVSTPLGSGQVTLGRH